MKHPVNQNILSSPKFNFDQLMTNRLQFEPVAENFYSPMYETSNEVVRDNSLIQSLGLGSSKLDQLLRINTPTSS
jgi:nucleoside-specific outer membrane channel protein Tsx